MEFRGSKIPQRVGFARDELSGACSKPSPQQQTDWLHPTMHGLGVWMGAVFGAFDSLLLQRRRRRHRGAEVAHALIGGIYHPRRPSRSLNRYHYRLPTAS